MFEDKNINQPQIRVTEYKKPESLTSGIRNRPEVARVPRRWFWAVVIVAAIVVLGALFLFIRSQQQLGEVKKDLESVQNDPAAKTRQANDELISQVGKLIILPENEQPTIATVSDLSKLAGQPFFAKAEVGDKVLIYQQAKKAILFRPSTNQIIELAPLNNNGQAAAPVSTSTSTPPSATPSESTSTPAQ